MIIASRREWVVEKLTVKIKVRCVYRRPLRLLHHSHHWSLDRSHFRSLDSVSLTTGALSCIFTMARGNNSGRGGNRGGHRGRGRGFTPARGRGRGGGNDPKDDRDFTIYDFLEGMFLSYTI